MENISKLIANIIQDFDDSNLETIIIEQSNMVVTQTRRIVNKYIDTDNFDSQGKRLPVYVTRELGYNATSELVYIKIIEKATEPPAWVPTNLW